MKSRSLILLIVLAYLFPLSLFASYDMIVSGGNDYGQLGDGTNVAKIAPFPIAGNMDAIACAGAHSLAIDDIGQLWSFGWNGFGQLGTGDNLDRSSPTLIDTDVIAISVGIRHSLYLKDDGTLMAMGDNVEGQLGDGTNTPRNSPVIVDTDVEMIEAGPYFSLYVKAGGTMLGMGNNASGQLGDGTTMDRSTPVVIDTDVIAISGGGIIIPGPEAEGGFTQYIKEGDTLYSIGSNQYGQFGNGTTSGSNVAIEVESNVLAVSAGGGQSLFIKDGGSLFACGWNLYGQLGSGDNVDRASPLFVDSNVSVIAAGRLHSMYVKNDDTLLAMGDNQTGRLGDGTVVQRTSPVVIDSGVVAIAAAANHSMYLKKADIVANPLISVSGDFFIVSETVTITDRTVGAEIRYTLDGSSPGGASLLYDTPFEITETTEVKARAYAAGKADSGVTARMVIQGSGTLLGMGNNSNGQLGDGTLINQFSPAKLVPQVLSVSGGGSHTLYLSESGDLFAQGRNTEGQLGDGTTSDHLTAVMIDTDVSMVSAGTNHSLYLKSDGTLKGMGDNSHGQLGDGTTSNRSTPIVIATDVLDFSAGETHSLFVKTGGELYSMGGNEFGQLGDGTTNDSLSPISINDNPDYKGVAAGNGVSFFIHDDGRVFGVGQNGSGQLGDNTTTNPTGPVLIINNMKKVIAGSQHTLFLNTDNSLFGTGDDSKGQLGGTGSRLKPELLANNIVDAAVSEEATIILYLSGDLYGTGILDSSDAGSWESAAFVQLAAGAIALDSGESHFLYVFGDTKVEAPIVTPEEGSHDGSIVVTMSSPTFGSTLCYTIDGTEPDLTKNVYTGPFNLSTATNVRVRAHRGNLPYSVEVTRAYDFYDSSEEVSFSEWATLAGLSTGFDQPEDDPNLDGLKNIHHFFFGSDPLISGNEFPIIFESETTALKGKLVFVLPLPGSMDLVSDGAGGLLGQYQGYDILIEPAAENMVWPSGTFVEVVDSNYGSLLPLSGVYVYRTIMFTDEAQTRGFIQVKISPTP